MHVFGISANGVTIKNLIIDGGTYARNVINVYEAEEVVLEDVQTTGGTAGVVLNNSKITIQGENTNIDNGSWGYAVNVDKANSELIVNSGTIGGIYSEYNATGETTTPTTTIEDGYIGFIRIDHQDAVNTTVEGGSFGESVKE